ncbi:hypothetical protein Hanom_Chr01g00029651 [Helianthus anomalus]
MSNLTLSLSLSSFISTRDIREQKKERRVVAADGRAVETDSGTPLTRSLAAVFFRRINDEDDGVSRVFVAG